MKKQNFKFKDIDLDVSRQICKHLMGNNHTQNHRMGVGIIIMISGVFVAKIGNNSYWIFHYAFDLLGYLIHGIGAIPIIKKLEDHID